MHLSELRNRNTSLKAISNLSKLLSRNLLSRNHAMYGVHTLKFESIDAEEMLRNKSGAMMREVTATPQT